MKFNRRQFNRSFATLLLASTSNSLLARCNDNQINTIESIDLYLVNVEKPRNFSHSTWHNRQHIFIGFNSGVHTGWAEVLASKNELDFDIKEWAQFMKPLIGSDIKKAIETSRDTYFSKVWNARQSEPVLMGLYDLMGKTLNKSIMDLWSLHGDKPVPAVFTILEREVDQALVQAQIAKNQGLTSHVKVKLFGDLKLDTLLITSMRNFFGPDTKIIGDPNRGYKHMESIDDVADAMVKLSKAGMNAVEDPSELDKAGWIELAKKVGSLDLIPDHIMRPAHKGIDIFSPEMGSYFNLHPNTMGTFLELNELAAIIRNNGRGLMIGDSSLVGPACTFWQQIAIGNGASWVEAIEKPQESDVFARCVVDISTKINELGQVELVKKNPGFGLVLDKFKLKDLSEKNTSV